MDFRHYDTRLAAYAVVRDDRDRILLALWNEADQPSWAMPGGGVEFGRLLGIDTHTVPAERRRRPTTRPMKSIRVVFEARVVGGELRDEVDGTTDEARWIPIADVPSLRRVSLVDAALAMATPLPGTLSHTVWSPTAGICTAIMRYVTNRRPPSDVASG